MFVLGITWGANQDLVLVGIASLVLTFAITLNGQLKDRDRVKEKRHADEKKGELAEERKFRELREHVDSKVGEVAQQVTDLAVKLVGTPGNPRLNISPTEGFVQRQERHNHRVDEELRTTNGGGTIKGSLGQLRTDLAELRSEVAELSQQRGQEP